MEKEYDNINPPHYKRYSIEFVDMIEKIYGREAVIQFCEITALKYRMRMGTKPNNPIEQELEKEKWYLDKAKEYEDKF